MNRNFNLKYSVKGFSDAKVAEYLEELRNRIVANDYTRSLIFISYEKIASALNVPMWQLFASPEEVQFPSNTNSVKCPHCQHEFPINVNVELKIE